MKTGWKTLMVAGGVVLGLSSLLLAGGGGGPAFGRGPAHEPGMGMGMMSHGGGPGGVLGPAAAQLNLTDEQKQAIRTICQQSRADANEVVGAIEEARAALHEAVIARRKRGTDPCRGGGPGHSHRQSGGSSGQDRRGGQSRADGRATQGT